MPCGVFCYFFFRVRKSIIHSGEQQQQTYCGGVVFLQCIILTSTTSATSGGLFQGSQSWSGWTDLNSWIPPSHLLKAKIDILIVCPSHFSSFVSIKLLKFIFGVIPVFIRLVQERDAVENVNWKMAFKSDFQCNAWKSFCVNLFEAFGNFLYFIRRK